MIESACLLLDNRRLVRANRARGGVLPMKKKDVKITNIALKVLLDPTVWPNDMWRRWVERIREKLSAKEYYVKKHRNALEGVSKYTVEVWKRA
jgi:hypothetical protein